MPVQRPLFRPQPLSVVRLSALWLSVAWLASACGTSTAATEFDAYDPLLHLDAGTSELPPWTGADVAAGSEDVTATTPACVGAGAQPDGTCCPAGQAWDTGTVACVPSGPVGCQSATGDALATCVPRWCATGRDAAGKACTIGAGGCEVVGAVCPSGAPTLEPGCPLGQFPQPSCVHIGQVVLPGAPLGMWSGTGGTWTTDGALPALPTLAPVIAAPTAPTPTAAPSWCMGSQGNLIAADDKSPCPACAIGERVSPDTGACVPITGPAWSCPTGFLAAGNGTCAPDPDACGTPWGGVQPGAGAFFVLAGAAPGGDGSQDKPFASLDAALAALPNEGGFIGIGPGTYTGNWTLSKSIQLRGTCASQVTLTGATSDATLAVVDAGQVDISGISVTGGRYGIRAEGASTVGLGGVWVHGATHVGMGALDGASVVVAQSVVSGTLPGDGNGHGEGLYAEGAALQLTDVRVSSNRNYGILVDGTGASLQAAGVAIDGTLPSAADSTHGVGMAVFSGAKADVWDLRVTGSYGYGVRLEDGVQASGQNWWIDGTQAYVTQAGGAGVALIGSVLNASDVRITKSVGRGLWMTDPGAAGTFQNLRVDGTRPQPLDSKHGEGVVVEGDGAAWNGDFVHVTDSHHAGVELAGLGAQAQLRHTRIADTAPTVADKTGGYGLEVVDGASLALLADATVAIQNSHDAGLLIEGAGSEWVGGTIRVWDTQANAATGNNGHGARLTDGVSVHNVVLEVANSTDRGIYAAGAGTEVVGATLQAILTAARTSDQTGGVGIDIGDGAQVSGRLTSLGSRTAGVRVLGAGTTLTAKGIATAPAIESSVVASRKSDARGGAGLVIEEGAVVTSGPVRIQDVHQVGVGVNGPGSSLTATHIEVTQVGTSADTATGRGISASGSAEVTLNDVRVSGMPGVGLFFDGTATTASVADLTVLGGTRAMNVQAGAQLVSQRVRVEGASEVALFAEGTGTVADVTDFAVHGVGFGVHVGARAQVRVLHAALAQLVGTGVLVDGGSATDAPTELTLADAEVATVLPQFDAGGAVLAPGDGLAVQAGGALSLIGVVIRGWTDAGLVALEGTDVRIFGGWLHDGTGAGLVDVHAQVLAAGLGIARVGGYGWVQDGGTADATDTALQTITATTAAPGDGVLLAGGGEFGWTRGLITRATGTGFSALDGTSTGQRNRVTSNGTGVTQPSTDAVTWLASLVLDNLGANWVLAAGTTTWTAPTSLPALQSLSTP